MASIKFVLVTFFTIAGMMTFIDISTAIPPESTEVSKS